jgi:diketogulonate reductase-like aldo/keto reductase
MTLTGDSNGAVPSITLNDENTMPVLGLGVADLSDDEAERAVSAALEIGCRLIDTAAAYGNETAVGRAIAASGIPRAELFVTTKLATPDQGFTKAPEACKASLERLGLDYVDLYLVHWPAPSLGIYVDAFGGLIQARGDGHARSIGVSNFTEEHLSMVIDLTFVTPAVNQIELHPLLNQDELRKSNAQHNLQLGNAVVFRSAKAENIASNLDVFDFELAAEHMEAINALNDGTRLRPDPNTYDGS